MQRNRFYNGIVSEIKLLVDTQWVRHDNRQNDVLVTSCFDGNNNDVMMTSLRYVNMFNIIDL